MFSKSIITWCQEELFSPKPAPYTRLQNMPGPWGEECPFMDSEQWTKWSIGLFQDDKARKNLNFKNSLQSLSIYNKEDVKGILLY